MMETLTIVETVVLLATVLYWQVHDLGLQPSRRRVQEMPTFRAWCIYRAGDDCANPDSPVAGREGRPV
jgi:hypothetical protein